MILAVWAPWLILGVGGAIVGSFLNVYIHRVSKNERHGTRESVFFPRRSYCPCCQQGVAWYDNIPLLSFVWLKGRCRHCHAAISWRYPCVELLGMLLPLLIWGHYRSWVGGGELALAGTMVAAMVFGYALLAITFVDMDVMIIPDEISLGGTVLGLVSSYWFPLWPASFYAPGGWPAVLSALSGAALGGGLVYAIAVLGYLIVKKDAMGGGDIKLMAMIGAFLGPKAVFLTLFLASLLGTIWGGFAVLLGRREWASELPFGPFLALGAWGAWMYQDVLWQLWMP